MKHWVSAFVLLGSCLSATAQQGERFSIATLNVDGLPQKVVVFKINADGPGSAGTVRIGKYLMQKDYDMVFMQEDFNYNDELTVMLEDNYQFDTWSGDVGLEGHNVDFLHLQNHRFECDGLMGCWKNGVTLTSVERTPWTDVFGKFSHANDELVTKGFRRYELTLASGFRIVVYNMHMDASDTADEQEGNDLKDREARLGEWRQLREEVLNRLDNRPVIVLGDLNSYYSRDNVESEFINAIAASGRASAKDVWVELMNNGTYPEHLEGFVYTEVNGYVLNGETLDKIIYINPTGGGQQLKAVSFSCDQDGYRRDGKMLGDHFPVAATFEVVGTATVVDDVLSIENKVFDDTATEIYDLYGRRMMESSKGLYIERNRNGIRKRIIK